MAAHSMSMSSRYNPPRVLLRVDNLHVQFPGDEGPVRAVDGVSFTLNAGQTLALVGESGCGKSLTALAILRLLPPAARVADGSIWLTDADVLRLPERELRALRGRRLTMIFQEPMTSLNPLHTAGAQIDEVLRLHRRLPARTARAQTVELLRRVGIPAPEQRYSDYPHQLSGGMRQRVMIALALACGPELLIADEPTTALDVTVQAQILALLRELRQERGLALLLISHDLALVARFADRVAVMYAGRIVETGPAEVVFADPRHPYTQALLRCTPRLNAGGVNARRLPVIPGEVPSAAARPAGCAFHPRCERAGDDVPCRTESPPLTGARERLTACWRCVGGVVALL